MSSKEESAQDIEESYSIDEVLGNEHSTRAEERLKQRTLEDEGCCGLIKSWIFWIWSWILLTEGLLDAVIVVGWTSSVEYLAILNGESLRTALWVSFVVGIFFFFLMLFLRKSTYWADKKSIEAKRDERTCCVFITYLLGVGAVVMLVVILATIRQKCPDDDSKCDVYAVFYTRNSTL